MSRPCWLRASPCRRARAVPPPTTVAPSRGYAPRARPRDIGVRGPAAVLLLATMLACGAPGDQPPVADAANTPGGTVLVSLIGEPRSLLPPLAGSEHEQAIMEVVYDRLADIGPALEVRDDRGFTPRLASAWRWAPDSMSIAFTLDPRAHWHDGAPVVSEDVRRTFALYTDPLVESGARELLANIDSVSTPDAATAVFWFKRRAPQQFYDASYHLFIMPSHRLRDADPAALAESPLSRAPLGTGRFRFVRWSGDGRIELVADTANYRGRPSLDRVVYEAVAEAGPAIVKYFTGESDFVIPLLPKNVAEVASNPALRVVMYPSLRYQLLTFNLRAPDNRSAPHPVLADVRVRRALAMATDRERVHRAVFDTIGRAAIGPVPQQALPDPSAIRPLPFDPEAARALLDSAGWRPGANGVRSKDGVPLRLEVLTPGTSENRNRMALLLQDQWRAVGAELVVQRLDVPALIERLQRGRFDGVTNGWTLAPGLVGLRQVWNARAVDSNFGRYANATFDATIDSMLLAFDPARRDSLLTRAVQLMVDDPPAIWLVEDAQPAGVHPRINVGTPSPLGWWNDLADWRIPPAQRIDRDRLGLATPP